MTDPARFGGSDGGRTRSTVYAVEYQTKIKYSKGSLIVATPDTKRRIPLEAVDALVMFAGQITTDAIAQCVRRRIRVSVLTKGALRVLAGSGSAVRWVGASRIGVLYESEEAPVERDSTRMCELLVGLGAVDVLGVVETVGLRWWFMCGHGTGRCVRVVAGWCGPKAPARCGWWICGVRPSGAVGVAQASLVLPVHRLCDRFVLRGRR